MNKLDASGAAGRQLQGGNLTPRGNSLIAFDCVKFLADTKDASCRRDLCHCTVFDPLDRHPETRLGEHIRREQITRRDEVLGRRGCDDKCAYQGCNKGGY